MNNEHLPVLLHEVLQALDIKKDGIYFDGTFGRGGHASAILAELGATGRLYAMDKDHEAIVTANQLATEDSRFHIIPGSFAMMAEKLQALGINGDIDGVLLDLGVSSPQLDNADRGFSFMKEGPLDMRMNNTQGQSAADWLASADEKEISEVLRDLGEERFHRRIARAISEYRQTEQIQTTLQLAALIERAVPRREKGKHPATRSFQAIRIHINRELEDLKSGLQQAVAMLKVGGRLAVISFHSLEDRIVKRFMREQAEGVRLPLDLPVQHEQTGACLRLVGKAIKPGKDEIENNIRARSATLRVAEKIA